MTLLHKYIRTGKREKRLLDKVKEVSLSIKHNFVNNFHDYDYDHDDEGPSIVILMCVTVTLVAMLPFPRWHGE